MASLIRWICDEFSTWPIGLTALVHVISLAAISITSGVKATVLLEIIWTEEIRVSLSLISGIPSSTSPWTTSEGP
jgi:hypothetical protein